MIMAVILFSFNTVVMADAYQSCVKCHGENGELRALGRSKVISKMSKAEILSALKGYLNGSYGGPMSALMKGKIADLSEAQMVEISEKIGK